MKAKTLLILFFILSQTGLAFAEINQKAWEQGLAALVKNVNINSLKSKPEVVGKLKKLSAPYSINDVKKVVKDYRLNLVICDSLQTLAGKYKDFSEEDDAKKYLYEDIFNYQLKAFAAKRQQEEIDELKMNVENDLDRIMTWNEPNQNEANEHNPDSVIEVQNNSPSEVADNTSQKPIVLQDNGFKMSDWVSFKINIISLVLIVVVAYLLWVVLKKRMDRQYREIKKLLNALDYNKASQPALKKLEDRINSLIRK